MRHIVEFESADTLPNVSQKLDLLMVEIAGTPIAYRLKDNVPVTTSIVEDWAANAKQVNEFVDDVLKKG